MSLEYTNCTSSPHPVSVHAFVCVCEGLTREASQGALVAGMLVISSRQSLGSESASMLTWQ